MTLTEIKQAVDTGKKVYWKTLRYDVVKSKDDYSIVCESTGSYIGLTWTDGVTLNGKEEDFFIND